MRRGEVIIGLAAAAVVTAGEALAKPRKEAATLTGRWRGRYWYAPDDAGVPFDVTLRDRDGMISGAMSEPNTFGDPAAQRLYATFAGAHARKLVTFRKVYDGTGGVSHDVLYEGQLEADGAIRGRWRIGNAEGPFEMIRFNALVS